MADIQNISDHTLLRVIHESDDVNWNFFAIKVIIARLRLKLSLNSDDEAIKESIDNLRDLFRRSSNIPNAIKDLQIIVERFDEASE